MAAEDDHPQCRHPSQVKGKKNKSVKQPNGPWYRHTAWFIPAVPVMLFRLVPGGLHRVDIL